ncbi:MAG: hypothetical protein AAFV51_08425 [Pseudomonadota bacterium]
MRHVIAAATALFALIASASAQDYLDAYKAYNAALERGDRAAAAEAAERAWRAAEEELGDDPSTAALAYNFGFLIAFSRPADAVEPIRRAAQLAEIGGISRDDIAPLVAYVDFIEDQSDRGARRRLRDRLLELDDIGVRPTPTLARVWSRLSTAEIDSLAYDIAFESALRSLAILDASDEDDPVARYFALLNAAAARGLSKPLREANIAEAYKYLFQARTLVPLATSRDAISPAAWQVDAWIGAFGALEASKGYDIPFPDIESEVYPPRTRADGALCPEFEWARRPKPKFPDNLAYKGYVGAVLVGMDFDGVATTNVRVLAEVPQKRFGEVAAKVVRKWRLKSAITDPECRKLYVAQFQFVLAN